MIKVRKSEERGRASFGWLDARHSFSFGEYRDPEHMGFRDLLVINDDRIQPVTGFGSHPHKNMEIITYIIEGSLEHKDSMGSSGIIEHGQVQRMSAGTGIVHSEKNPSKTDVTRLLQIWVQPAEQNIEPSYENIAFNKSPGIKLLVSPDGKEGSAQVNQDFYMYGVQLSSNDKREVDLGQDRHAWVQVVSGSLRLNGIELREGDGASVSDIGLLELVSEAGAEAVLMNLR